MDLFIYFLSFQISDIHISRFHYKSIGPDLKNFLESNIRIIKPSVVLVTGMDYGMLILAPAQLYEFMVLPSNLQITYIWLSGGNE